MPPVFLIGFGFGGSKPKGFVLKTLEYGTAPSEELPEAEEDGLKKRFIVSGVIESRRHRAGGDGGV